MDAQVIGSNNPPSVYAYLGDISPNSEATITITLTLPSTLASGAPIDVTASAFTKDTPSGPPVGQALHWTAQ